MTTFFWNIVFGSTNWIWYIRFVTNFCWILFLDPPIGLGTLDLSQTFSNIVFGSTNWIGYIGVLAKFYGIIFWIRFFLILFLDPAIGFGTLEFWSTFHAFLLPRRSSILASDKLRAKLNWNKVRVKMIRSPSSSTSRTSPSKSSVSLSSPYSILHE